jgi:hypothetical protein
MANRTCGFVNQNRFRSSKAAKRLKQAGAGKAAEAAQEVKASP